MTADPDVDLCDCPLEDRAMAQVLARVPADCPCLRCWALDTMARLKKEEDRFPAGLFIDIARAIGTDDLHAVADGWDLTLRALDEIVMCNGHTCRVGVH